jgi:hypothetical protein
METNKNSSIYQMENEKNKTESGNQGGREGGNSNKKCLNGLRLFKQFIIENKNFFNLSKV